MLESRKVKNRIPLQRRHIPKPRPKIPHSRHRLSDAQNTLHRSRRLGSRQLHIVIKELTLQSVFAHQAKVPLCGAIVPRVVVQQLNGLSGDFAQRSREPVENLAARGLVEPVALGRGKGGDDTHPGRLGVFRV
jgi:hypothetical protein